MKQATPKKFENKTKKQTKINSHQNTKRNVKIKYGTSKLERDFARDFLDANDINYIYQYEVKELGGRFFDFAITSDKRIFIKEEKDGLKSIKQDDPSFDLSFFIEVDGDYW